MIAVNVPSATNGEGTVGIGTLSHRIVTVPTNQVPVTLIAAKPEVGVSVTEGVVICE
jgi:hypothetical protein